jgi:hypothetical protein
LCFKTPAFKMQTVQTTVNVWKRDDQITKTSDYWTNVFSVIKWWSQTIWFIWYLNVHYSPHYFSIFDYLKIELIWYNSEHLNISMVIFKTQFVSGFRMVF